MIACLHFWGKLEPPFFKNETSVPFFVKYWSKMILEIVNKVWYLQIAATIRCLMSIESVVCPLHLSNIFSFIMTLAKLA